ncbi:MAG: L-fuculose-phosphate aldolase [Bdellovibrionales bacterium]|nr:L-fuculose-phosphate aldolase [Bdellovibrionales bacterium]
MADSDTERKRLCQDVVDICLRMNALGINQGTSGNVSVRWKDGFLITPSGVPYEETSAEQIVEMGMDGERKGDVLPSSEWRFHLDIYKARSDAGAVVHTHAPFCTTLACLHREIPPFHYMVAAAGGKNIRCAKYATFGTQDLADNILDALRGRKACLIANHGMIALHDNLKKALALAVEVEALAAQYWRALAIGDPKQLSDSEMDLILEKFKTYGKQPGLIGNSTR